MSVSHLLLLKNSNGSANPSFPLGGEGEIKVPPPGAHVMDAREMRGLSHSNHNTGEVRGDLQKLFRAFVLCSRAGYLPSPENMSRPAYDREIDGDATEKAIFRFCHHADEEEAHRLKEDLPKIGEIPFNSRHKWQLSFHQDQDKSQQLLMVVKGAPERIIGKF